MNMLLLYPSETKVDTARNQDMLDFYMEKTGSVSAEHLQHKLQLYNDATDEMRRDDEYMCDLTKKFQSGAEPTAVVNEGRAGYTEYFERWVDNDEDDDRRTSNELWEENSRSAAEEQRLAAERNASAAIPGQLKMTARRRAPIPTAPRHRRPMW
jgi:Flp pilus assembly CpaE family ATPase